MMYATKKFLPVQETAIATNRKTDSKSEDNSKMRLIKSRVHAPTPVTIPLHAAHRTPSKRQVIRKGTAVFSDTSKLHGSYIVARGEVMIMRDGRLIDIVEPGELLDARIWQNATAIALTDCTLAPQALAA